MGTWMSLRRRDAGSHGHRRLRAARFLTATVAGLSAAAASAEPYIAVREGYRCSQCHVNMTGGGMRNEFGNIYTQTTLPYAFVPWRGTADAAERTSPDDEDEQSDVSTPRAAAPPFFTGRLTDFAAIGGDLRAALRNTRLPEEEDQLGWELSQATLYLACDLIPDRLTLYVDEQVGSGSAQNREAFVLWKDRASSLYAKAGKMFLPYGFRLQDDTAFIRQATGFNYNNPDIGLEVGAEPGPFSLALAVTNGTQGAGETNRAKQYTLSAAHVGRRSRVGVSVSDNDAPGESRRRAYGVFGGYSVGRFTLLGEVDRVFDDSSSGWKEQLATFTEIDFLISKGLNAKITYEFLDPNADVDEDARDRFGIGFEPFLTQFLQLRVFYRVNNGIPQNPLWNAHEIFVDMHVFF